MKVKEVLVEEEVAALSPHEDVMLIQQDEGVLATLVRIQTVARSSSRDQSTGPTT